MPGVLPETMKILLYDTASTWGNSLDTGTKSPPKARKRLVVQYFTVLRSVCVTLGVVPQLSAGWWDACANIHTAKLDEQAHWKQLPFPKSLTELISAISDCLVLGN